MSSGGYPSRAQLVLDPRKAESTRRAIIQARERRVKRLEDVFEQLSNNGAFIEFMTLLAERAMMIGCCRREMTPYEQGVRHGLQSVVDEFLCHGGDGAADFMADFARHHTKFRQSKKDEDNA